MLAITSTLISPMLVILKLIVDLKFRPWKEQNILVLDMLDYWEEKRFLRKIFSVYKSMKCSVYIMSYK